MAENFDPGGPRSAVRGGAVRSSLRRIGSMVLRYLYLHRRSLPRALEVVFWPVMDLLVWGFVTVYLQRAAPLTPAGRGVLFLLGGMILFDLLYRSQQAVTVSLAEEMWTRNVLNLLASPLRAWEWIAATFIYGLLKVAVITAVLGLLAWFLYAFNLFSLGPSLVPCLALMLLFGWAMGLLTAGMLLRWGHAAEALIWGIPFLLQPFSAVFYPLETLPGWLQKACLILPSTHLFEGMRAALAGRPLGAGAALAILALDLLFAALGALFYAWMFASSRRAGRLGRLGTE